MSAHRWAVIYVSVTRNDQGMVIIVHFYVRHVLLAFNISPLKIEFALSLFSQKCESQKFCLDHHCKWLLVNTTCHAIISGWLLHKRSDMTLVGVYQSASLNCQVIYVFCAFVKWIVYVCNYVSIYWCWINFVRVRVHQYCMLCRCFQQIGFNRDVHCFGICSKYHIHLHSELIYQSLIQCK